MSALRPRRRRQRRRRRLTHFPSLSLRCINSHHGKTHNGVGCFLFPPRLKRYGPQTIGEGSRSRTLSETQSSFSVLCQFCSLLMFSLISCGSSSGRSPAPPAVILSSRTRRVFLWGGAAALVADAPSMIKCGETETAMGRRKTPVLPPLWAGNLRYIIHKVV